MSSGGPATIIWKPIVGFLISVLGGRLIMPGLSSIAVTQFHMTTNDADRSGRSINLTYRTGYTGEQSFPGEGAVRIPSIPFDIRLRDDI